MGRNLFLLALAAATAHGQSLPGCAGPGLELIHRTAFSICHSASHKAPLWTAYRLGREQLNAPAVDASPRFRFRADRTLTQAGAEDSDYAASGYQRGHLVPARDLRFSEAAVRESYLLTNAIGQRASLNAGKWRSLERAVRGRAAQAGSAIVYTGAIYCAESPRIGPGRVAVPCYLFKVAIFGEGGTAEILAVLMPNAENPAEPWTHFVTTLDEVQRRTGLAFPR